ncbi:MULTISPECIES: hypothetical protein [Streptomyces]|uniref:Uncharacterized protein n=1 Tax=Streptomyces harbinensis TaxID=1176198 RepID=A0A1I6WCJ0_9ACTN|nr:MULTISPECIES: hypothetical protein [Streptomyces]SFT23274.1 hypothetical protein SAMN05444716_11712 [Streptomyces harbinensis]
MCSSGLARTLGEDGFSATVRHDLDFAEPGTPTGCPWWVRITGRIIQVAPTG